MVTVPLPIYEPDKNRYNTGAMPTATNALPTPDGWAPVPAADEVVALFDYITDELFNRLTDESGNRLTSSVEIIEYLLDEEGAYLLDENGDMVTISLGTPGLLGDISLPATCTGLIAARKENGEERIFAGTRHNLYELDTSSFSWVLVSSAEDAYSSPHRWQFTKFGSWLYAQNGRDAEQMIDLESGTEFEDNVTAPIARCAAQVTNFMFRGNLSTNGNEVQWSAFNNPKENTSETNLSGNQPLPSGDEVMALAPVTGGVCVICRSALHLFQFTGDTTYVFRSQEVDGMRGSPAASSLAMIGQDFWSCYFDDGFYLYQSGQFRNIGFGRVNDFFIDDADPGDRNKMIAMVDPERSIVWWSYIDRDANRKMLGYSYLLDRWCNTTISAQASAQMRTFAYSTGNTPMLDRDLLRFGIITDNGVLAYLTGRSIEATFTTNEWNFNPKGRSFANGARLIGDAATFTITPSTTNYRGGEFRTRTAATPSERTKFASFRADGETHYFDLIIPANIPWTTALALDVNVSESGK